MRYVRRILALATWIGALGAATLLVAMVVGYQSTVEQSRVEATTEQERPRVAVTYVEAVETEIEDIERSLATVEAKWSARIAAEVAATVETIVVDAGDQVKPGMLLATLDERDFEIEHARAAANVRRLEANIANSERVVERNRKLAKRGHVTEVDLDSSETELMALREELKSAQSEVRQAERDLDRTEIRAPHGGTVAERLMSEGDYAAAGGVILEIPRTDRLQVRIPVPESAAETLAVSMTVRLKTVNAETPVEAQITDIQPRVSASNRTVTVIVELDNPGGWRPGNSLNTEIVMDTRQAIALTPTSVVRRMAGNVVYVLEGDVARERSVSIGRRTQDWIEITDGVSVGDRIVVDGAGFMSDGARVDAVPDDSGMDEPNIARGVEART